MNANWRIASLGEVCEIVGGGTPSKAKHEFFNGTIPWATVRDMKHEVIRDTEHKITKEAVNRSSTNVIPKGNVVIATRVGLGKVCLLANDTAINQDLKGIIPKDPKGISVRYLFQWLRSISHIIEDEGTGATIQGVKVQFIKSLQIPLPPLPEQHCIVSILDEAFAAIAKAKANAEKNLHNAKELFESYMQKVFANPGEDCNETTLEQEIDLLVGFAFKSKYYSEHEDDVRLLRGDNIIQGELRWDDVKRWRKSDYSDFERYHLREGDIVLAMDRPWVKAGLKVARLSKNDVPALLLQRTACLRNRPKLNNSFLYYLVRSKMFMQHLIDVQTGIGVPHISGKQILQFSFRIPPLDAQDIRSQQLDTLSTESKKLVMIYQGKLNCLEELKRSILTRAFKGELKTAVKELV